ncbi:MAG: outer membrane protein assembly factor BamD [Gammaproteobacteria bacterium]|nr:outer membrane protein assembly factor BamD [Gammaproteobacteria bacterium]
MRFSSLLNLSALFFAAFLTGCASSGPGDPDDETYGMPVAELYQEAKRLLTSENYKQAIEYYEKLESRFPYGTYAERARIEMAYAHYKSDEPETAIIAADRFIKLHPNHANVDYAYYLRGLASFDNSVSFLDRVFDQEPSERDSKSIRRAFNYFSELVQRFPKSRYLPDSINRMKELRENLARYEIHVANYYQHRGAYLAAVNRAKYVVENYQGSRSIPDALALMITSYRKLGMYDLATDAFRILELNHPKHEKTRELKLSTSKPTQKI